MIWDTSAWDRQPMLITHGPTRVRDRSDVTWARESGTYRNSQGTTITLPPASMQRLAQTGPRPFLWGISGCVSVSAAWQNLHLRRLMILGGPFKETASMMKFMLGNIKLDPLSRVRPAPRK